MIIDVLTNTYSKVCNSCDFLVYLYVYKYDILVITCICVYNHWQYDFENVFPSFQVGMHGALWLADLQGTSGCRDLHGTSGIYSIHLFLLSINIRRHHEYFYPPYSKPQYISSFISEVHYFHISNSISVIYEPIFIIFTLLIQGTLF